MFLFLVTQADNPEPGAFMSAVVVAETERQARSIHPQFSLRDVPKNRRLENWVEPDRVCVRMLGDALQYLTAGEVICSARRVFRAIKPLCGAEVTHQ